MFQNRIQHFIDCDKGPHWHGSAEVGAYSDKVVLKWTGTGINLNNVVPKLVNLRTYLNNAVPKLVNLGA